MRSEKEQDIGDSILLQTIVGCGLLLVAVVLLVFSAKVGDTSDDTLRMALLGFGFSSTFAGTSTLTGAYSRRDSHRREGH